MYEKEGEYQIFIICYKNIFVCPCRVVHESKAAEFIANYYHNWEVCDLFRNTKYNI